jgi:hypothetical protein
VVPAMLKSLEEFVRCSAGAMLASTAFSGDAGGMRLIQPF